MAEGAGFALLLELKNDMPEKSRAIQAVEAFGKELGWSKAIGNEIALVLEEWLTNVISYGFPSGGAGRINLGVRIEDASVVIQIQDNGIAFDPVTRPEPDLSMPLEERPIGGFGIHMIKKLVDQFAYARRDETNVITLQKSIIHPKLRQS